MKRSLGIPLYDQPPLHSKQQHGGFASAAKKRGEELVLCGDCGRPPHPPLVIRQAIHVPPPGMPWWKRYLVPVAVILGALVLLAQATPA